MQDKDIYTFFKARKHMFEEAPGDAIWARIESGLDTSASSSGKGFSFKTLLFWATALLTIGITGLVVFNDEAYERPASSARENKHKKIEAKPILVPEAVKIPDAVMTTKATPNTAVESKVIVIAKDTVKKKKPYVAFQKITGKTTAINKDSIPFDINNVETNIKATNGRLTVDTKGKLTPSQFNQLIEKVLRENEQATGTLVTIKAPGHKVFRQIIKTKDNTYPARQSGIYDTLPTKLTVKSINNQSGVFEKILLSKDSLVIEPEYIDFKLAEPGKE